MRNTVSVGVIGLGKGRSHLKGYHQHPAARIRAICDIDEERLEQALEGYPDARGFTDYHQMLALKELDAVSVALPNNLHAPVSIEAMENGKHVLCEKPMAMNAAEAENMKNCAERTGKTLMLNFNMRFMQTAATIRPLTISRQLGTIYHVTTTYTRRNGYPNPGSWFGQKSKSGGGPLIDLGVHRLDLALWLMDYPRPIAVTGKTYNHLARKKFKSGEFDCEDFSVAMIRFENGATLYLAASWDGHQQEQTEQTMQMYGTEGSIFERDGQIMLCTNNGEEPEVKKLPLKEPSETSQEHFVNSILNDTPPGPSAEHGVIVMKILDAIYESAATDHEVVIGD
jgi:predicted dehydrogenase